MSDLALVMGQAEYSRQQTQMQQFVLQLLS